MVSRENRIVAVSALVTLAGLGTVGIVASTVGLPGEWAIVVGFVFYIGAGHVLPQAYLMQVDDSVGQLPRLGVITLMVLLVALALSNHVTGTEQIVLWSIVGVSVLGVFAYEALNGYRHSMASEDV